MSPIEQMWLVSAVESCKFRRNGLHACVSYRNITGRALALAGEIKLCIEVTMLLPLTMVNGLVWINPP